MKAFFKSFLGTLTAMLVAGLLLMAIFFGLVFGKVGDAFESHAKKDAIDKGSVLHLTFKDPIVDRASEDPLENFDFEKFESKQSLGIREISQALEKAKTDDKIEGVFLEAPWIQCGPATLVEVRRAIEDFKSSGKWVVGFSEGYSTRSYYIATLADQLYLYPEGYFDWKGLSSKTAFMKGALDRLGVHVDVIKGRNNSYKSAIEPFTREGMSPENREQVYALVNSIWEQLLEDIQEGRQLSAEALNEYADELQVRNAADAVRLGLVDSLLYRDQVNALLRERLSLDDDKDVPMVTLAKYAAQGKPKPWDMAKGKHKENKASKEQVAVLYASGMIVGESNDKEQMDASKVARSLSKLRKDTTVKAVVFRVNSPGGSALASDVIWREINLLREQKPVVVSMGDLAASGGYYIACAADKIFASPTTITGSIGVYGMIPSMGGFFEDKLGVTFDGVKTHAHADIAQGIDPLSTEEKAIIQGVVDTIYDRFVAKVAMGRKLPKSEVYQIARGRVWTGAAAKGIGLVDELGGLEDAIEEAVAMASLDSSDYKVVPYPKSEHPFSQFFDGLSTQVRSSIAKAQLGEEYYGLYKQAQQVKNMEGVQMMLPMQIRIEM